MQNEFNAKNAFKLTPCGPSEPCSDYDDCESGDDITDKDLAILLKEETKNAEDGKDKGEKVKDKGESKDNQKEKQHQERQKKEQEEKKKKEEDKIEEEQREKKRPCRKVKKNPFFTNRLTFSTDLPPRPPFPPPQFLPLADEDDKPKVCPKKKKKCKKKRGGSKSGGEEEEEEEEDTCDEGQDDGAGQESENPCETNEAGECKCNEEPDYGGRRRCKKPRENKFPCRKKASDVSVPPQPRRIPALLKDLPLKCPKDIPEVEKQIWMSRDNTWERPVCKKKCNKKQKVEELLNQ